MARMLMTWPIPIRWRGVKGLRIIFCHIGRRKLSIVRIEMVVAKRLKTAKEEAGILKWGPRCRSIVRAWRIVRLPKTPIGVAKKIPEDHIGMILTSFLRSSTSSTVHSLHDLAYEPSSCLSPSVFCAARFKNLWEK